MDPRQAFLTRIICFIRWGRLQHNPESKTYSAGEMWKGKWTVIVWSRTKRKRFLKKLLFLETFCADLVLWPHTFLSLSCLSFALAMMCSLHRAPQNCWRSSNKPRARWSSQQRTTSILTESWKPSTLRCEMESASWVLEVRCRIFF